MATYTVCNSSAFVTTFYCLVYFASALYVLIKNKGQFNRTNLLVFAFYGLIFLLQLVALYTSLADDGCSIQPLQKLLLFESDILMAMILQLVLYRMLTLKLKLVDTTGDQNERLFFMQQQSKHS